MFLRADKENFLTDVLNKNFETKITDVIVSSVNEKDSYIKVVRVLSEKLLPIGFGYKVDYNTHPIIKELDFNKESLKLPHYFA